MESLLGSVERLIRQSPGPVFLNLPPLTFSSNAFIYFFAANACLLFGLALLGAFRSPFARSRANDAGARSLWIKKALGWLALAAAEYLFITTGGLLI